MTHQRIARQTRGFTLTEAAIVLGIVGLILGAIWVAAASVYANLRVKQTSEQILTIAQAVRALHATSTTIPAGINALDVARAGGIPKDMLDDALNPTTVTDVWGGAVNILRGTQVVAGDSFGISFARVPQQPCVDLAVRNSGAGRDAGLLGIANALAYATAFPMDVTTAVGVCPITAVAGNTIVFTFRLRA
ncbi:type 4 pilus major pilin [Propionivibrio sp.]|uniref:type 4 pilus major pilin n=1 Tax=Propionivibrio sp. TaxID=2212460 RepID=UPI0026033657|nr:type 4 pilus major pilin [Propionivibrio sp.]